MCTVCSITQSFDPVRHIPANQQPGVVRELVDALAGPDTTYSLEIGGTFEGEIARSGDSDWVAVELTAGNRYEFSASGSPSGSGTLPDPQLLLYDNTGKQVAVNDDGGIGLDAQMTFLATQSGTYFIGTKAFSLSQTGTYQLQAQLSTRAEQLEDGMATLDELAQYLTDGYWNDEGSIRRSFDTSDSTVITVDLQGLTAGGQKLARWAMESWERVIDVSFQEVRGAAQIRFDDNAAGAYAISNLDFRGNLTSSEVNVDRRWVEDYGVNLQSYAFATYIHEIGHAMGLGHLGDYNGDAQYTRDAVFKNDSWNISVMSYFNQSENTSINASYADVITLQVADVLAAQTLYGASQQHAGDTIWGANSTIDGYLGIYFDTLTGGSSQGIYNGDPVTYTIVDSGGRDLWDLSYSSASNLVNMRPHSFSNIDGLIGNVAIARGTLIENVSTGSGNDSINGNSVANLINAGNGRDEVDAGDGNDTVIGGGGGDALFGRAGADVLRGGGNMGTDFDRLYGGDGSDTLFGDGGFDRLYGEAGDDVLNGGGQADNLFGGGGNDTLFGEQGFDRLFGGDGNDLINGGIDNDGHFGQVGNDTLYGGLGNDRFFGGEGNDLIEGEVGNDTLSGDAGFDVLVGGAGNDHLYGRFNADTFVFTDGHGRDTVFDFDATNGFEKIDLSAVSAIDGLDDLALGNNNGGAAIQSGRDVVIDTGGGGQITLINVNLSQLDATDFLF